MGLYSHIKVVFSIVNTWNVLIQILKLKLAVLSLICVNKSTSNRTIFRMDDSIKGQSSHPDDIPSSKAPRSRPPVGFREKILHTALPPYSGPYSVGFMDLEIPAREPRTFSDIKRDHKHLLSFETVLFSIFYPSGFGSGHGNSPDGLKKWSRATWMSRPRAETIKGYAEFYGLPRFISTGWFGTTAMFTKLPAFRNAKLAEHWPSEQNSREGGYNVKNKAGKPPPGEDDLPVFPLLIFSHGLGGTRTTYSSVCGEFASYGFIVISMEHRDGSGPRTFVNLPGGRRQAPHDTSPNSHVNESSKKAQREGYEKVDYVFPQGNSQDTMPGNKVSCYVAKSHLTLLRRGLLTNII